jgi:chromate transporter
MNDDSTTPQPPSFAEAFRFWLKLGFISFGGPTGQIAIMHEELVEKKKWIGEDRFLHALNYCMLLPGPEAQQLAIYIGWLLHRTWGGIVAGVLFVLPSALILWALSWLYLAGENVTWVEAIFYGLKPAVLAIVVVAVLRIGKKALKNEVMWTLAALAFIAIFFFKAPFPLIVAFAALIGWVGGKLRRDKFLVIKGHGGNGKAEHLSAVDTAAMHAEHTRPSLVRAVKVTFVCLLLWGLPIVLIGTWMGWNSLHAQQGIFFSKAAMVTFGGAYAVLPYIAQQAVEKYQWLSTPQMMDGLGLAETTPGPLIMVLQFVGFVGGWQHPPDGWSPLAAATLGAAITTWVTFVPCFLWIFLGAPYIERLRGNEALSCALSAVTAAVVGVVLNLAVWFALHAVFPHAATANTSAFWQPDWFVIVLAVVAFFGMQKWKWDVIPVVFVAALLGVMWRYVF